MKNDIKIIALDLDGTLLDSQKRLSEGNRAALEEAAAKGVHIVPTTGRFFGMMPQAIRDLPFVRYAITINGAQVYDRETDTAIVREEIPLDMALDIIRLLDRYDVIYDCYRSNWGWMTGSLQAKAGSYFQKALEERGIRCASGGGNDLLQTAEIATLRSFLEAIYNPRQDIPLLSVLASPVFGFTADELAAFRAKRKYGCIYDALCRDDEEKSRQFVKTLENLRREARMSTLSQLLEKCYALTSMDSIYAAMAGGEARSANLQLFFQLAADFEVGNHRDLGQFLDHLRALEDKGLISTGASAAGCVTIMSIHKSKGLEFPVVFLCGLSRRFNRDSLQARILADKELGLGLSVADQTHRMRYPTIAKKAIAVKMTAESLSEELRVLYVAVTRARDRLIMTYMHQNLENKLKDIALRADFDGGRLLTRDVSCPGDWVLLTALHKTEAGELFALGGRPKETTMGQFPWKIQVTEAPRRDIQSAEPEEVRGKMPENTLQRLQRALAFSYPYAAAVEAPSKQTATAAA